MKNISLLIMLFVTVTTTHAQDYYIHFKGIGGSTIVDSVKVENLSQCKDTMLNGSNILHLTSVIGINEFDKGLENKLNIYPNPTTGNCIISFDATAQGNASIGIYDLKGKRILQAREVLSKGSNTFSLIGLHKGVYFIKIESESYSFASKLISFNTTSSTTEIKHIYNTPYLNIEKSDFLKDTKSEFFMQYNQWDLLKLTGFSSGIYQTILMFIPHHSTEIVTFNFVACADADSNHYAVVQIHNQLWMAENLKTTKYRNGDVIPNISDSTAWTGTSTGAYCWLNNDSTANEKLYGKLYNWYSVKDNRNIAPVGWHVSTDAERSTLVYSLGGQNIYSGVADGLKATCTSLWQVGYYANNGTGFTGLPGGGRDLNGSFDIYVSGYLGKAFWWTSTELNANDAESFSFDESEYVSSPSINKSCGASVRCIKDL